MTIGEQRVRAKFNPSANTAVEAIKHQTALLIDLCQEGKNGTKDSETLRLWALAQTAYEEAAMWAVKAATA
jgi:hypothetical protein